MQSRLYLQTFVMMLFRNEKINKGFTLIELLVVMSIIGLISGVILMNVFSARSLSRDNVRVADLGMLQNSLGRYFVDFKSFPATLSVLEPSYINKIPLDPLTNAQYLYAGINTNASAASCEKYHLGAVVENVGFVALGQDHDAPVSAAVCTGSTADFDGNATGCSGPSATSPDACFDLIP